MKRAVLDIPDRRPLFRDLHNCSYSIWSMPGWRVVCVQRSWDGGWLVTVAAPKNDLHTTGHGPTVAAALSAVFKRFRTFGWHQDQSFPSRVAIVALSERILNSLAEGANMAYFQPLQKFPKIVPEVT